MARSSDEPMKSVTESESSTSSSAGAKESDARKVVKFAATALMKPGNWRASDHLSQLAGLPTLIFAVA
jgi:hypothetical protein